MGAGADARGGGGGGKRKHYLIATPSSKASKGESEGNLPIVTPPKGCGQCRAVTQLFQLFHCRQSGRERTRSLRRTALQL